jgi:hypothetical protein
VLHYHTLLVSLDLTQLRNYRCSNTCTVNFATPCITQSESCVIIFMQWLVFFTEHICMVGIAMGQKLVFRKTSRFAWPEALCRTTKSTDRLCSIHEAPFRQCISQQAVVHCGTFINKNLSTRVSCFCFISAHWLWNICHFNSTFNASFIIFPHCPLSYFLPNYYVVSLLYFLPYFLIDQFPEQRLRIEVTNPAFFNTALLDL